MRSYPLPLGLAVAALWAGAAAARLTGAAASTMTTGSAPADSAPAHHTAPGWRHTEAARLRSITPRPPLNVDCTPARERAARSELEKSQYRLNCGQ